VRKATVWALMLLVALAFALTPAGTEIRNQASASYVDSAGQSRTTTSNEVVTVVQPVYGFTITPDSDLDDDDKIVPGQTQKGLPGGKVYFPYTVTNQANTTDTIDLEVLTPGDANLNEDNFADRYEFTPTPEGIYLDENCNGQIDPGETDPITSVELAMGASACLIVEATLPTSRDDNSAIQDGDNGYLNLKGQSQGDATKTDDNNWAEAVATEAAILSATKSASPSGSVTEGTVITYTIQGANVGGSDACAVENILVYDDVRYHGILVWDDIPAGTVLNDLDAEGTAGAGETAIYYLYNNEVVTEADVENLEDVSAVILFIEDPNYDPNDPQPFFPQGAQYTLTFRVKVTDELLAGKEIQNQATVVYNDGSCDGSAESNTTINEIAPSYAVLNGPQGDPDADGSGFIPTYTDPSGREWSYEEITGAEDGEKITSDVYSGDTVYFPFTLQNDGNAPDSYELAIDDSSSLPEGWTCQIVAKDGTTPISGAVGPLDPKETYDYVVKCTIPADYTEETDDPAAEVVVKAQSTNDPNVNDTVKGVVDDVLSGYDVDVAQVGKSGDDDESNDNPDPKTVNPGESVQIPFEVANTGEKADTYDLTVTFDDDLEGWDATIYPVECGEELSDPPPAPVTDTGLIDPDDKKCFVLVVEVPEDQAPLTLDPDDDTDNNVTVTATSKSNSEVYDSISTDINVNKVYDVSFTPDRSGTVTSPGTIVYDHTVTNNGNAAVDVKFSQDGGRENWTYQISTDGGSTWSSVEDATLSGLAPGASAQVKVRVIVPDGEAIGTVDSVTFEAIPVDGAEQADATPDDNRVTDTTTIVGGDLRLEKEVDKTEAKPGEYLEYTVTASNIGTADLKEVIISDPIPAYTDYVSVSASVEGMTGTVLYSKNGSDWSDTPPATGSSIDIIYVGVDTDGDGSIGSGDTMPPGAEITITLRVKVQ